MVVFPAVESVLPAVNESPNVPFLSSLPLLLCGCARSLPNCHCLSAGESVVVHAHLHWHSMCKLRRAHRKYTLNNCIPVALLIYIHTYIQMQSLHATQLVASLPTQQQCIAIYIACLLLQSLITICGRTYSTGYNVLK